MIEKLKALEAAATPGPWTNAEVWCDQNSGSDSTTEWKAYRADADFITALRPVAHELIRLWEACNTEKFHACLGDIAEEALDAINHKAAAE